MTLSLTLPYPISANRYWRTYMPKGFKAPVTTVSQEAKEYKREVQLLARAAGIRKPLLGRIRVEYTLYPHRPQDWQTRQRKHGDAWDDTVQCIDLDNAQKVMLDALKGIAFEDDGWVREIHARRAEPDEKGARVEVQIASLLTYDPQAILFGAIAQERSA